MLYPCRQSALYLHRICLCSVILCVLISKCCLGSDDIGIKNVTVTHAVVGKNKNTDVNINSFPQNDSNSRQSGNGSSNITNFSDNFYKTDGNSRTDSIFNKTITYDPLEGYEKSQNDVNLAFLPSFALVLFIILIFLRICVWHREEVKYKTRGCSYDITSYVIMSQGDDNFRSVEIKSDTTSNYDTVNSTASFFRKNKGVYDTMHSVGSLQDRIDAKIYETVSSITPIFTRAQQASDGELVAVPTKKKTNKPSTPKSYTVNVDDKAVKIKDTRFRVVPALDNHMRNVKTFRNNSLRDRVQRSHKDGEERQSVPDMRRCQSLEPQSPKSDSSNKRIQITTVSEISNKKIRTRSTSVSNSSYKNMAAHPVAPSVSKSPDKTQASTRTNDHTSEKGSLPRVNKPQMKHAETQINAPKKKRKSSRHSGTKSSTISSSRSSGLSTNDNDSVGNVSFYLLRESNQNNSERNGLASSINSDLVNASEQEFLSFGLGKHGSNVRRSGYCRNPDTLIKDTHSLDENVLCTSLNNNGPDSENIIFVTAMVHHNGNNCENDRNENHIESIAINECINNAPLRISRSDSSIVSNALLKSNNVLNEIKPNGFVTHNRNKSWNCGYDIVNRQCSCFSSKTTDIQCDLQSTETVPCTVCNVHNHVTPVTQQYNGCSNGNIESHMPLISSNNPS